MTFILLILIIVTLVALYSKVRVLRQRVEHIEGYLAKHATPADVTSGYATPTSEVQAVEVKVEPLAMLPEEMRTRRTTMPLSAISTDPDVFERFGHWLKEDWLMKLAGLLLILGMGWFVSYAIAQNWIGESGRIALGLITGAGVLALGRYRLQGFLAQGSILMFTGAAIMVLTLFAARELYDMFTPLIALVLMFGISALLGLTSVMTRHQPLAIANVLLAGLAPLLVNYVVLPLPGLMLYLLVLSIGAVGVTVVTGWRLLPLLSLVVVSFYSYSFILLGPFWRSSRGVELDVGLLYAYVFTALFFGVSILAMRVARNVRVLDLLTAVLSALFLMAWILAGAKDEWQSLLFVVWALVFACGAFLATRLGAGSAYFYSYAGVGATYLGIATALELDGPSLTIAAICEATLFLWLGYRIRGSARHLIGLALPMIIPILLSLESMGSSAWRDYKVCAGSCLGRGWFESVFHSDAFVLVLLTLVLAGLGYLFKESRARHTNVEETSILTSAIQIAFVLAGIYASIIVWLVTHAGSIGEDTGTMLALLVYTVVATIAFMAHRASGKRWQHYTAIVFTVFVVGRLLLVEAWQMELLERVITFLLVGLALGVVAWIERGGRHATKPQDHEQPNIEHHA